MVYCIDNDKRHEIKFKNNKVANNWYERYTDECYSDVLAEKHEVFHGSGFYSED